MQVFTDKEGREWTIDLTQSLLRKAVKTKQFANAGHLEKFYEEVYLNLILLGDFLWFCCQKQAQEQKVTQEQFLDSINGDVADEALVALREEILLFLPKRRRQALIAGIQLMEKLMEKELEEMSSKSALDSQQS